MCIRDRCYTYQLTINYTIRHFRWLSDGLSQIRIRWERSKSETHMTQSDARQCRHGLSVPIATHRPCCCRLTVLESGSLKVSLIQMPSPTLTSGVNNTCVRTSARRLLKVASVGKGSIRTAIFTRQSGYLNVEKWVYNSKCVKTGQIVISALRTWRYFQNHPLSSS